MESGQSFWDRRPWLGFALFMGVVSAVGLFLAIKVGERPHYRINWTLKSEYHKGNIITGDPGDEASPIRLWVRTRVATEDDRGLPNVELLLTDPRDGTLIAHGYSGEPEGHLFLPVPERYSRALFAEELSVVALIPGRVLEEKIYEPKRGISIVTFFIDGTVPCEIRTKTEDAGDRITPGDVRIGVDGQIDQRSRGYPIVDGKATIGAVAHNTRLAGTMNWLGRSSRDFEFQTEQSKDVQVVRVPIGPRLARVVMQLPGEEHDRDRVQLRLLGRRDGVPFMEVRSTRVRKDGEINIGIEPCDELTVESTQPINGMILQAAIEKAESNQRIELDESVWRTETPLVSGHVTTRGGDPASGLLVQLQLTALPAHSLRAPILGSALTDEDGAFAFQGVDPGVPFVAVATGPEVAATSGPLSAGKAVVMKLAAVGNLSFSLSGAPLPGATAALTHPGIPPELGPLRSSPLTQSGALSKLPPGIYDFHLLYEGKAVHTIKAVEVKPGPPTAERRLTDIPLPEALQK